MKLEPRIEKLEARQPIDEHVITEIALVGIGHDREEVNSAVARLEDGIWTLFEGASRR